MLSGFRARQARIERESIDRELTEQKQAELKKSLEPHVKEQARLLAELREAEIRATKKALILRPSFDFKAPVYVHDGSTAAQITAKMRAAYKTFVETDGANLSDAELLFLREFLQANDRSDYDLTNPKLYTIAQEFITRKLNPEALSTEAVRTEEKPEQETNEVNPFKAGTREADRWDRQQAKREFVRETSPIWVEALQPLVNGGFFKSDDEQAALFQAVKRQKKPFSVETIRHVALSICPDAGTPEEKLDIQMTRDADTMNEKDWREKYGIRVRHSYAPNIGITENVT
jgi:hypothetical protein